MSGTNQLLGFHTIPCLKESPGPGCVSYCSAQPLLPRKTLQKLGKGSKMKTQLLKWLIYLSFEVRFGKLLSRRIFGGRT